MPGLVLHLPYQLSVRSTIELLQQLEGASVGSPGSTPIEINFGTLGFVEPFPTMVLAHGLRQILALRASRDFETTFQGLDSKLGAVGYLKHLGFFRFVGLATGKRTDEANTVESRFLPLTTIRRGQVENKGRVMQATLDLQAERLATVIFPGKEGEGPAMMLAYALREIMRNSFEHGRADHCMAMAQRWNDGSAEIAIADYGIGIFNSLGPIMNYKTPDEALSAALLPGISSQSVKGDSEWANSGFGLYVVSELGKKFGAFAIISSGRILHFQKGQPKIEYVPVHGTMVKLRVDTRDAEYFPNILFGIVAEGERQAGTVVGAIKSASKMSKQPVALSSKR
jgi:hypothetical protein